MNSRPMSNIDKQGRQVQRYANFGVDMMEWDDGGYVKHSDYLALLDENLQLQRDKDSLEAVAISMRDDMREAREKLEAAEKRIAELEARPANPINFKESTDADYCRSWAWNEVKKELAPDDWTVGDNCTYYGFFCWGWDSRRQFNEQRAAGIGVKGE